MNNHTWKILRIISIALVSLIFGSCRPQESVENEGITTVRIAVLPILDTLPMYVAESEGLFTDRDIDIEFIPAGSAPQRDELIKSGQVDGMINEVVSTIFYNRESNQVKIVRYARVATPDSAIFRILASGQSGIKDVNQLKDIPIGVSQGTVIEYLTERLLQAEGFSPEEIEVIAVPDIGQRMALLGSGELDAAMLPDPLASLVMSQGSVLVIEDSSHPQFSHSVYSFRSDFIQEHPNAIRGFLAAIEEAVELINADPDKYADLLAERELLPPPLVGKFTVPQFVTAGVPSLAQWDDVVAWINEKGLEVGEATYDNSINSEFLP